MRFVLDIVETAEVNSLAAWMTAGSSSEMRTDKGRPLRITALMEDRFDLDGCCFLWAIYKFGEF